MPRLTGHHHRSEESVIMDKLFSAIIVGLLGFASLSSYAANMASAEIINTDGEIIGEATLQQTPTGVLIYIWASALPPGPHAIHLHSVGKCEPDFKAAKGHIDPHKRQHGLLNSEGPERGDLPNLFVAADGTVKAEFFTTLVSLDAGTAPLLDDDGSAFVIHANRDDHMTQPIGGAGARIACGVISRK